MRRRCALVLTAAFLAGISRVAAAQQTSVEVWPELDAYVRVSPAARWFVVAQPVISGDDSSLSEAHFGGYFEVGIAPMSPERRNGAFDEDKLRYLRVRVGYRAVWIKGADGENTHERRVVADLTPRFFLPFNVLFMQREAVDFRWIDGAYSWRFRPRVWLERETRIGKVTTIPYWSVEPFYDSRYATWNRTLYQTGIVIPVSRQVAPEIYYGRQIDRQPTQKTTNALGVMATLYY